MELVYAERIIGLCKRFGCLPEAGGLLDQDAEIVRMLAVHDFAHAAPDEVAAPMGGDQEGMSPWE
jgi:hypothetical protein